MWGNNALTHSNKRLCVVIVLFGADCKWPVSPIVLFCHQDHHRSLSIISSMETGFCAKIVHIILKTDLFLKWCGAPSVIKIYLSVIMLFPWRCQYKILLKRKKLAVSCLKSFKYFRVLCIFLVDNNKTMPEEWPCRSSNGKTDQHLVLQCCNSPGKSH